MRRHDTGVHDVNDRSGADAAAAVLAVERAVALVDPIEVPEQIGGSRIAASFELRGVVVPIENYFGLMAARRNELLRPRSDRIYGERKQNSGERFSQRCHLIFRTSWTTSNKIQAKRAKWQVKLL